MVILIIKNKQRIIITINQKKAKRNNYHCLTKSILINKAYHCIDQIKQTKITSNFLNLNNKILSN